MNKRLTAVLVLALTLVLLLSVAGTANAVTYFTSKPKVSEVPHKSNPFRTYGYILPRSTSTNPAVVKIRLWMKYGDTWGTMWWKKATLSKRAAGGSKYSCWITIPMKGWHGLQAYQYRHGKLVSKSKILYFNVQP